MKPLREQQKKQHKAPSGGYGYGLWLVLDQPLSKHMKHIGHVTVACYGTKEEVSLLYQSFQQYFGTTQLRMQIYKTALRFEKPLYSASEPWYSWGYSCRKPPLWQAWLQQQKKTFPSVSFSEQPHTSMDYYLPHTNPALAPKALYKTRTVSVTLHRVNLLANDPAQWYVF